MSGMSILGDNMRALREARGWSEKRLAAEASRSLPKGETISQQTIGHIETGKTRRPGHITEIAEALDKTPKELRSHILVIGPATLQKEKQPLDLPPAQGRAIVDNDPLATPGGAANQGEPPPSWGQKDLPIMGSRMCGEDGVFEFNGKVLGRSARPDQLEGVDNAYCVYAVDDSMKPMYRHGYILYVNPIVPPKNEDGVLVQLTPKTQGEPPRALVKQFVSQDNNKLVLKQLHPTEEKITIPRGEVLTVHVIILSGPR